MGKITDDLNYSFAGLSPLSLYFVVENVTIQPPQKIRKIISGIVTVFGVRGA